jgi:hypothetical protein
MLKKWLAKRGVYAIEDGAQQAYDRGDSVYTYRFHPSPTRNGADVAKAIQDVEAVGWRVEWQTPEGAGLTRVVNLTFRRASA